VASGLSSLRLAAFAGIVPNGATGRGGRTEVGAGAGLAAKAGFPAGCFIYDRPNLWL